MDKEFSASRISRSDTVIVSKVTLSKMDVYFATARSPLVRTSLNISFTVASISSTVWVGLFKIESQSSRAGL